MLNQSKRSIDATKVRGFHSPSGRWNSKIVRKRPRIPRTHSKAGTTCKEWRSQWRTSKANGKGFNRQKQKMTLKPAMTSGQSKMTSFIVVILNLEVNSSARRNIPDSTEKNIDVTRATYSNLDVLQDKLNDDHWRVDVNRSLSDSWRGITKLTLLKEKPPKGYMWSGREGEQKFKQLPDIIICGLEFGPLIRKRSKNGRTKNQSSIMLED